MFSYQGWPKNCFATQELLMTNTNFLMVREAIDFLLDWTTLYLMLNVPVGRFTHLTSLFLDVLHDLMHRSGLQKNAAQLQQACQIFSDIASTKVATNDCIQNYVTFPNWHYGCHTITAFHHHTDSPT